MTRTTMALSVFASAAAGMIIGYGTAGTATNPADRAEQPPPMAGRSLDMGRIIALNPAIAEHYGHVIAAPCKPQMGLHYAPHVDGQPTSAPSVVLSVNPVTNEMVAAEVIVAPDQPWQPWFDQPEGGEPTEIAPGIHAWTQHVYLVDPATIDDCPDPGVGAGLGPDQALTRDGGEPPYHRHAETSPGSLP
jgi:hypothetical protein